jgi:hypothetical protein
MTKREIKAKFDGCEENFKRAVILFIDLAKRLGGRYDAAKNTIHWGSYPIDPPDPRISMLLDYLGVEVKHDEARTYLVKKGKK